MSAPRDVTARIGGPFLRRGHCSLSLLCLPLPALRVGSTVMRSRRAMLASPSAYARQRRCYGAVVQKSSWDMAANTVLPSAMHAIHGTPSVELSRLTTALGLEGRLVAKLEYLSPGFSKKDRIARQMLEEARANGSLTEGQPVVELTSGNTGTGLAISCAALGHPFIAVMSRGNSMERARMMRALGAEVVLVDQCADSIEGQVSGADLARVFDACEEVVALRKAFRADQFELLGNMRAHEENTGPELLQQAAGSGIELTGFVDFVGSGGTFAGVAK